MEPIICNHLKEELDLIEQISISTQTHLITQINNAKFHTGISNHLVFHITEHFVFSILSVIAASVYGQTRDEKEIGSTVDNFVASIMNNKERFVENVLDVVNTVRNEAVDNDTNIN